MSLCAGLLNVYVCVKHHAKQTGEMDLSMIDFEEKCCILVFIHECMLHTNHILRQSEHTFLSWSGNVDDNNYYATICHVL